MAALFMFSYKQVTELQNLTLSSRVGKPQLNLDLKKTNIELKVTVRTHHLKVSKARKF